MEELWEKYGSLIKEYQVLIALGVIGFLFLGYGLFNLFTSSNSSSSETFPSDNQVRQAVDSDSTQPVSSSTKIVGTITIDIEGAVQNPGVYTLNADSRLQDAVVKAGGFTANADHKKIAQNTNLAQKLVDGAKIYLPFLGDNSSGGVSTGQDELAGGTSLIPINSASEAELDNLPGVGKVTADKIIENRPYINIEDLQTKKVVNTKVFSEIKDKVSLN